MTICDWSRWHDLLDIRDGRPFTPTEQAEYDRYAEIVAKLDQEEVARCAPGVAARVKSHEEVLASIERLTAAVRAAAGGVQMSDEPKATEEDYDLKIRLAKMAGLPIVHAGQCHAWHEPHMLIGSKQEPPCICEEGEDGVVWVCNPWNPLEDERQCFRHVVAALKRLRLNIRLDFDRMGKDLVRVLVYGRHVPTWSIDRVGTMPRALCLAALEAWEELKKNDGR